MIYFLYAFLGYISLYHILNTVLIFGVIGAKYQGIFAFSKDIIWILFFVMIVLLNYKSFLSNLKRYYKIYLLFVALVCVGIIVSLLNHKSLFDMFVGFKYNIYYIFILISSLFVGEVFAVRKYDIKKFFVYIFYLLCAIIGISLLWQVSKFILPDMFYMLGYGKVGDYIQGRNPPIYYRTGPGGRPRLSGIFSGPNNYGFLLIVFFSFFVGMVKDGYINLKNRLMKYLYVLMYALSSIFTLSRGVILGIGLQVLLMGNKLIRRYKKISTLVILAGIVGVVVLSYHKLGSTLQHMGSSTQAISYFINKPLGYGLGSSGASIYYNGSILPENTYLGILIDLGIFGFISWLAIFLLVILKTWKLSENNRILRYLVYGLLGLMLNGLFLHVFDDSMVNYLFLVVFGISIGYYGINTNK